MEFYVFPAHAGMNRYLSTDTDGYKSVPRTRGDEPVALSVLEKARVCSPHTRG